MAATRVVGRQLRRGDPLAAGLRCLVAPAAGLQQIGDIVNPNRVVSTQPTWGSGASGGTARDFVFSNASTSDLAFTSGPWTVAAWFRVVTAPVTTGRFPDIWRRANYVSESVNQGWVLQLRPPGDAFAGYAFTCLNNNAASTYMLRGGTIAAGDHVILATSTGGSGATATRWLYLDAVQLATKSNSQSNPASDVSTGMVNASDTDTVPLYAGFAWNRVLTSGEVVGLMRNPLRLLERRRGRLGWIAALSGATPNPSSLSFSASIGNAVLAAGLTAAVPPPAGLTFAMTLTDVRLSASITAAVPPPSGFTFAVTTDAVVLAGSLTAAVPPPSSFTLATTLDAAKLASAFTAAVPPPTSLTLASTLDAASLTSTFTAVAPAASSFTLTTILDSAPLAAGLTALVPPAASLGFSSALDPVALTAGLTTAVPGAATVAFSRSLDDVRLASASTTAAPPGSSLAFAAGIGPVRLSSSFTAAAPAPTAFAVAGRLDWATLTSGLIATAPAPSAFTLASLLDDVIASPSLSIMADPAAIIISRPSFLHDRSGSRHPN